MPRRTSIALCGSLLLGCAAARGGIATPAAATRSVEPEPPALSALEYTFTLDAALTTLAARVCMHGAAPAAFVHGSRAAIDLIRAPRWERAGKSVPLPVRDGLLVLDGVAADSCIAYEVDLDAARERDSLLLAYPLPNGLATSVELFLWRPAKRPSGLAVSARFSLPRGVDAAVPWTHLPGEANAYRIDERVFAFTGHAAFGRLTREPFEVAGARVELVTLDGFPQATRARFPEWIRNAAATVAGATGRFPADSLQVIVAPTAPSPWPIRFGHAGRGGAPSVLIFLPTDTDGPALRADWIAIHELSHFLHPFVAREDAWLSEGLATYLQEVLRVRAGLLDAQTAWRRIYDGARLGRDAEGTLAHETRIMPTANNYRRVYWAGAAIALFADVALRERSGGSMSLDKVLSGLEHCREQAVKPYPASALLAEMDRIAGGREISTLAEASLSAPHFPELDALYARLGLLPDGRTTTDGGLAWVRDAIMLHQAAP